MPPPVFFLERAGAPCQADGKVPDVITVRGKREGTFGVSEETLLSESLHICLAFGRRFLPSANPRNAFATLCCLAGIKLQVSS